MEIVTEQMMGKLPGRNHDANRFDNRNENKVSILRLSYNLKNPIRDKINRPATQWFHRKSNFLETAVEEMKTV